MHPRRRRPPTEDPRTGEELVADAVAALRDSGAVRAESTFTQDGQEAGLDLQLQGDDAEGSLTLDGQTVEVLKVGGEAYLQAPAGFWVATGSPEATTEDGSTMSVLADGSDYPVLIEQAEGEDPGSIAFSGFGEEQDITAPADFIELADLGG